MENIRNVADLISADPSGNELEYVYFWGVTDFNKQPTEYGCFNQWSPHNIVNTEEYYCMEQYMMITKAIMFNDQENAEALRHITRPIDLKAKIAGLNKKDWNDRMFQVLVDGNLLKFKQHSDIAEILLSTGDAVIVGCSTYDEILGIGTHETNARKMSPKEWVGKNILGFVLMEVRELLKQEN